MPATSYTAATATDAVQTELQEVTDGTAVYLTDTRVLSEINLGMAQVAQDTQCRRTTTTITVNAGQAEYSLAAIAPRVLNVLRCALPTSENSTDEFALSVVTMEELDGSGQAWRNQTGTPRAYMRWGQGFHSIRLYPEPDSTYTAIADASAATFSGLYGGIIDVSGLTDSEFDTLYGGVIDAAYKYGSLRVDYVASSTDVSGTQSLEATGGIPVQYQDAVIYYACARLCESDVPISQQQKAPLYWAKYHEEVAAAKRLIKNQFQSKPAAAIRGSNF